MWASGVVSTVSVKGPVMSLQVHEGGDFLDQLKDCQLLNDSDPWN
jgi:hypothetical protein